MQLDGWQAARCPGSSTSSPASQFNVWTFLTSGVVVATIAGNIINNVNSNNNNNNNNNNQNSQNSNNQNANNNANLNSNDNMVSMAMGRDWAAEGEEGGMEWTSCVLRAVCEGAEQGGPAGRAVRYEYLGVD